MWQRESDRRAIAAVLDQLEASHVRGDGRLDPGCLAEAVGRAVNARGCVVTVHGKHFTWGEAGSSWWRAEIHHDGSSLGQLAVSPATPLPDVVDVLAPLLAMVALEDELGASRRAGDAAELGLRDGRLRAAAEMDRERRGAERDLHDGAQHHLVALVMAVGLLEHAIANGDEAGAAAVLSRMDSRLDDAELRVLRTAEGFLPAVLVADGLAAALTAELSHHETVSLDVHLPHRVPAPVESTVYFVCMEAVNNAHKHAPGASISVSLIDNGDGLRFEVRDDGPGFAEAGADAGLHHLGTRMAEIGGTVEIVSAPGSGTAVIGHAPPA
ncbi:ATP-binding protein [Lentzea sp. DG1S-22]|uniref:sensor histidine kinase n=1 Tax=Lentzea sp. DG1S-22 TaxID=3108822 RepID=UPI002E75C745|nr:ATP-binding protein [Lentzea sp. DG1S-22]WVH82407.1 ATP-binding protein [Lentzea sp. DG1S-22]